MKHFYIFIFFLNMFIFMGCVAQSFIEAQQANTVASYDKFLKENKDSVFSLQAKKLREEAFFERSKDINTVESYNEYLSEYPQGVFSEDAKKLKSTIWLLKLKNDGTKNEIEDYIETYMHSGISQDLKVAFKLLFQFIQKENSHNTYEQFIHKFKDVKAAKRYISRAKREIENFNREEKAYSSAKKKYNESSDIKGFVKYLRSFPKGKNSKEAIKIIKNSESSRKMSESLLKAIRKKDLESIQMLIKSGANVNSRIQEFGPPRVESPLKVAINSGSVKITRFLLSNNADTQEDKLLSAFFGKLSECCAFNFVSCSKNYFNLFKELVSISNNKNKTEALITALRSRYTNYNDFVTEKNPSLLECQINAIKILVESGIDMNTTFGKSNDTFLTFLYSHYRCNNRGDVDSELVVLLAAHGAPVNKQNSLNRLPIEYAIQKSDQKAIDYLLKSGANINYTFEDGNTLLMRYAKEGSLKIVKKLVSIGAKTKMSNNKSKTAYQIALENSNFEIAKYLKNK